jgi:flagellar motility protein MotE (MotC chaperone)
MLTRFDFSSDVAYDAYLLERGDRNAYVSVVLSLQEKNNELQAKIEKLENDYTSVVCCWQEETEESVALKKKNDKLWNIVRSMDQAVSDLYDLL